MKSIIVTGGTGFIGSHTCLLLLENNFKVIIIDSLENSHFSVIQRMKTLLQEKKYKINQQIQFFKADLRNEKHIDDIFCKLIRDGNSIEGVIHFAGLKAVEESLVKPLKYWDYNIVGSINLFKIMDKYNCKTLVFSSSATIYRQKNNIPIKETDPLGPINPYGNTKFVIEKILKDLFNSSSNEWRICNLRYFNPIGAHSSGLLGEDPLGTPTNIFPLIMKVASKKQSELKIFVNDWNTTDGTCLRDYIHIMDLAEGHMVSLKYLFDNPPQLIDFNIGTGIGTSVLKLINTFKEVNEVEVPYVFAERREGDIPIVIANNFKSREILNWTPKRNLEAMCKDGWKWQSRKEI